MKCMKQIKKGCPRCSHGYKGRLAILEVLIINDQIRDAITNDAPKKTLRELVYTGEVITLLQDGLNKVIEGETTFEEILKIIDLENDLTNYEDDNLRQSLNIANMQHRVQQQNKQSNISNDITSENVETIDF